MYTFRGKKAVHRSRENGAPLPGKRCTAPGKTVHRYFKNGAPFLHPLHNIP